MTQSAGKDATFLTTDEGEVSTEVNEAYSVPLCEKPPCESVVKCRTQAIGKGATFLTTDEGEVSTEVNEAHSMLLCEKLRATLW